MAVRDLWLRCKFAVFVLQIRRVCVVNSPCLRCKFAVFAAAYDANRKPFHGCLAVFQALFPGRTHGFSPVGHVVNQKDLPVAGEVLHYDSKACVSCLFHNHFLSVDYVYASVHIFPCHALSVEVVYFLLRVVIAVLRDAVNAGWVCADVVELYLLRICLLAVEIQVPGVVRYVAGIFSLELHCRVAVGYCYIGSAVVVDVRYCPESVSCHSEIDVVCFDLERVHAIGDL